MLPRTPAVAWCMAALAILAILALSSAPVGHSFAEEVPRPAARPWVLRPEAFRHHADAFNRDDHETVVQHVPNAAAWAWMVENVPLFECPDPEIERTYWFRWWTFRKHLRRTPDGFVVTELLPAVGWAGKHNTIVCAAGHHLYEGRWLRDPRYLDDYSRFWFRGGGDAHRYTSWLADAIHARSLVTGDSALAIELLPDLVESFEAWERERRDPNGLFWQEDGQDGMEVSIGVRELHGYTPWYFHLPDPEHSVAWREIVDPQGFRAPFGPTTVERRHPRFMFRHEHECLWNGPSWPYATSVTLTALANLLDDHEQAHVGKKDYLDLLGAYARSHRLRRPDGSLVSWIDEDLDPDTGEWIARRILPGQGQLLDRVRDEPRRKSMDAPERPARPLPRAALGARGRHVPARPLGRGEEALPHVVLGRRAGRAQCHRPRHEPRRPRLDEARGEPHLRARPCDRLGEGPRHGLSGDPPRRLVPHVRHRLPRRAARADRPRPLARWDLRLGPTPREPADPARGRVRALGPRRRLQALRDPRRRALAPLVQRPARRR
ncbi:MAG: hypothetical protein HY721_13145 [Planctomycetes bacterium]|nr:hypothetical protein [Planctomycetota bacterium]